MSEVKKKRVLREASAQERAALHAEKCSALLELQLSVWRQLGPGAAPRNANKSQRAELSTNFRPAGALDDFKAVVSGQISFVEAGEQVDFPKLCSAFARTGCCAQTFVNIARVVS